MGNVSVKGHSPAPEKDGGGKKTLPGLESKDLDTARRAAASSTGLHPASTHDFLKIYSRFATSSAELRKAGGNNPGFNAVSADLSALEKEFSIAASACKRGEKPASLDLIQVRLEMASQAVQGLKETLKLQSGCQTQLIAIRDDADLRAIDKACSSSACQTLTARFSSTAAFNKEASNSLNKTLRQLAEGDSLEAYEALKNASGYLQKTLVAYLGSETLRNVIKSEAVTVNAASALKQKLDADAAQLLGKQAGPSLAPAKSATIELARESSKELAAGIRQSGARLQNLFNVPQAELLARYAEKSFSGKDSICFDNYAHAAAQFHLVDAFCKNFGALSHDIALAEKSFALLKKDRRISPGTELARRINEAEKDFAELKAAKSPDDIFRRYHDLFLGKTGKQGSLNNALRLYEKAYPVMAAADVLGAHSQALHRNQNLGNYNPAEAKKLIQGDLARIRRSALNGNTSGAICEIDAISARLIKGVCMQANLGCPADASPFVVGYSSYMNRIAAGQRLDPSTHNNTNEMLNDLLTGCSKGALARATALEVICTPSSALAGSPDIILSAKRSRDASPYIQQAAEYERQAAVKKIWDDAFTEAITRVGTVIRVGAVVGSFIPPIAPVSQTILIADCLLSATASANDMMEKGFNWPDAGNIATNVAFAGLMRGITPGRILAATKLAKVGKATDVAITAGVGTQMATRSYQKFRDIDYKGPKDKVVLDVLDAGADGAMGVLAAKQTAANLKGVRGPAAGVAATNEPRGKTADRTEIDRAARDVHSALRDHPHLEKAVTAMLRDTGHPMDIVRALRDPLKRPVVLQELKALAANRPVSDATLKGAVEATSNHPLLVNDQGKFNYTADGKKSSEALRARLVQTNPSLYSIGDRPTPAQMHLLERYQATLAGKVQIALLRELQQVAGSVPKREGWPAVSTRTKSADGMVDKIHRMRSGDERRAPRPAYCLADMPDAVGGRITVRTVDDLAAAMKGIERQFGNRIIEKDNFYVSNKRSNPYRVVTYTVLVNGTPCEVQLTTLRASLAADIGHNTLYKPIITLSDDAKRFVEGLQKKAAYSEHSELFDR